MYIIKLEIGIAANVGLNISVETTRYKKIIYSINH
jgi:hypothetical protein